MLCRDEDVDRPYSGTEGRLRSSRHAQVELLKAKRLKRLRRRDTQQVPADRTKSNTHVGDDTYVDAGLRLRHVFSETKGSKAVSMKRARAPRSLGFEERIRSRQRRERKRKEEEDRVTTVEDARREKRRQHLIRLSRRTAARVGFEVALSNRAEQTGICDFPVLAVEIEFVGRGRWVLFPFWKDSSLVEEVGKLVKQEQLTDNVAAE
ncbi:unnamed protein product, partial [Sphacelaria rigidula]